MVLIHHLKSAKYLQPSYPSLGYISWRGNTALIFLVEELYVGMKITNQNRNPKAHMGHRNAGVLTERES
jgi:hypothetical protein